MKSKPQKGQQAHRLLSTVYGKIEQVFLAENGHHQKWSDAHLKKIRNDFEQAGIEVLTLRNNLANPPQASGRSKIQLDHPLVMEVMARARGEIIDVRLDIREWFQDLQRVQEMGHSFAQSRWVQDAFCVQRYDEQMMILLQSMDSKRFSDRFLSHELALNPSRNLLVRPTELHIEGGNILVGDDFALIGRNTLAENWLKFVAKEVANWEDSPKEALQAHFDTLNRRFREEMKISQIIWIGTQVPRIALFGQQEYFSYQPIYHLDLFVTLGGRLDDGRELVFVADPRMANEVLQENDWPPVQHGLSFEDEMLIDEFVFQQFDAIAAQLEKCSKVNSTGQQFVVKRLPMLVEHGVCYSYNNSLVEFSEGRRRYFVPSYLHENSESHRTKSRRDQNRKFRLIQDTVRSILTETNQSEVVWVGEGRMTQSFAHQQASLRCMTKVLRRSVVG